MSSPLAIAGVTAVLKDLLNEGLINHDLSKVGSFSVTALPPDRITIGATEPNQLNLYLYLVTPNQGWRNVALPSRNGKGDRLTNQPLALNLHYMLTAYGSEDFNAEILLGYAMHVLHENPVPTRQQIRRSLGGPSPVSGGILPPSPSPFGSVMADDLADQAELLKVTPQSLSSDEMSKLWTAFQSKYRPSSAYMVSVVLIQATGPTVTALPVLKRGDKDRGVKAITGALPSIESVRFDRNKPAAELGNPITILGRSLVGDTVQLVFRNQKVGDLTPAVTVVPTSEQECTVNLPAASQANDGGTVGGTWPAGFYSVRVQVGRIVDGGTVSWSSNEYPFALAPRVTGLQPSTVLPGDISLTLTVEPAVQPHQRVSVLFGEREVQAPIPTATTSLVRVTVPGVTTRPGEATSFYVVRVRIDGVDSIPLTALKPTDPPGTVPTFATNQLVKVQ
jgi:hypothetical protein